MEYLPRALIIVDTLNIAALDFRQLLDASGYSTDLISCEQVTLEITNPIKPNVIFLYFSKPELPGNAIINHLQNNKFDDIPMVALTHRREIANELFSIASVVLLLPVSEQRLINFFSLLGSIDNSAEKSPWDSLTGFYTPSYFNSRLRMALEHSRQIKNSRFVVYMINLGYPSSYDNNGGDERRQRIVQGIAKVLKNVLRPADIVSRFEFNQFMILIEDTAESFTPTTIAGRMQLEFEDYLIGQGLKDEIKIDIGVIYCNSDYRSAEEIVSDAQMALQMAKQDVLGSYKVFIRNRPKNKRPPLQS